MAFTTRAVLAMFALMFSGCAIFSSSIRDCASLCKIDKVKYFEESDLKCVCEEP